MFDSLISASADINGAWMFVLYACVALFVIVQSTVYLVSSLRRAKKINMDMGKIKKVITSSAVFTILPSVGIFIGVVILAGAVGIPLASIRLSIVGSLQYETLAADTVAGQVQGGAFSGLSDLIAAGAVDAKTFVTFCFAMSFGIIWGPLFCLFFYKKFQPKMLTMASKSSSSGSTAFIFAAVFIGMVLAYLSVALAEPFYLIGGRKPIVGKIGDEYAGVFYPLIAVVVSAVSSFIFEYLIKKKNQKWLENFALAFSMLLGMSAVAGVNAILVAALNVV